MSADGAQGLTIIAFVGSVFSPYYALARARGRGDPANHVAMNVALYGSPRRWAMTERGRADLDRSPLHIAIGSSAMRWDGRDLTITIDEITVPLPSRLRGTATLRPRAVCDQTFQLDAAGRHRWRPIAPSCDVDVRFEAPDIHWRGTGYVDTNDGDEPLESAFRSWTWSRFDTTPSPARIFYDVVERDGMERRLSLAAADGLVSNGAALACRDLPTTGWGIARAAPCDAGAPQLLHTMESAPFYARSAIRSRIDGADVIGVHESLSLTRVAAPIVRAMLPFKMPRRTR